MESCIYLPVPASSSIGFVDIDSENVKHAYYYLCDHVGSVLQIVDETGAVVNRYDYDPFGNINWDTSYEGVENRYTFQGREFDSHRQDYYFRNRIYVPEWGSFTGPDMNLANGITGEPNGVGSYVFCRNNALDNVDPLGLAWGPATAANVQYGYNNAAVVGVEQQNRNFSGANRKALPIYAGALAGAASGGAASGIMTGAGFSGGSLATLSVGGVAAGLGGDTASQLTSMSLGEQDEFNKKELAISGGLGFGLSVVAKGVTVVVPRVGPTLRNLANKFKTKPIPKPVALGDLTAQEMAQIQAVVDQSGKPLDVVGSAARSVRKPSSDIDYIVSPHDRAVYEPLKTRLPALDKHDVMWTYHNEAKGPAIHFEPNNSPVIVPGEQQ